MKSLKINTLMNMLKVLMSMLFPLISFPYVSRILGPAGIGKVDFSASVVSYFSLFASLGISTYGIREGAKVRDHKDDLSTFVQEIFIINMVSTVFSYVVFGFAVCKLSVLHDYLKILCICGLNIGFTTIGIEWLYGALEEYTYITVRSICFQLIAIILMFFLIRDAQDYLQYAFITIFAAVGSNLFNIIHSRKFVVWKKKQKYNFKRHFKPILIIFGLNFACSIYMSLDKTMLGVICGDKEVGLYSAAIKINRLVLQLILSIGTVILARLSYLYANRERETFNRLFLKVFNYVLFLTVPSTAGLILLSKQVLGLLSGNEYLEADITSKILSLIIIIIGASNLLSVQIFIAIGKEKYSLLASGAAAFINFLSNLFLIPQYGKVGAAISTVMAETIALIVCVYFARKIIDFHGVVKNVFEFALGTFFFIPVFYVISDKIHNDLIIIVVMVLLSACVYGFFLLIIRNSVAIDIKNMIIGRQV
ncbi:MAG: flippase [Clostridium sp.]|nr:flippase [Clostridium sp.]